MKTTWRDLLGLAVLVSGVSLASDWWIGHSDRSLGSEVASLARPGDIRMISSETCAICAIARTWFTEHRVPFEECTVERDPACAAEWRQSGAPGTPVIVVRGRPQLGFDADRLRSALEDRDADG